MAEAFVKYLFTPEAQREFAKIGLRPSEKGL
jgi:ABC-type sulfate transport system substrate-binding protein